MTKSPAKATADFKRGFEKLSYSQDYSTTFSSFLDFALWQLSPHARHKMKEEEQRLEKYKPEMGPVMAEMFNDWTVMSDDVGEGFVDALGDLFMECVSFGRNGQFFTPQPICDMMANLTHGSDLKDGASVCDPACGSARTLLSIAKMNRKLKFYGADNDLTCVKMAALNLLVNSMEGEIAWMDTLRMEHYRSYSIKNIWYGSHLLPILTIQGPGETKFLSRLKLTEGDEIPEPVQKESPELKPMTGNPIQQLLFQF